MNETPLEHVKIAQGFWGGYQKLIRETVIPFQYQVFHDALPEVEPSAAIRNIRIAAGLEQGEFYGFVFQDSDLAKWLEAVGYRLATHPDAALEKQADDIIDLLEKAQQPDGYLNTYYIVNGLQDRFTNLVDCHELYCLGHFIEAAVAYYQGTGKAKLLDIVRRFTDLVDSLIGPEPEKLQGYPGHQEIELALVRLYQVTKEKRYLDLALYFINQRGKEPSFFLQEYETRGKTRHWGGNNPPDLAYCQAHKPVREQTEAVGHAVRALYMYTGMAHLAEVTGDTALKAACKTLWNNIVQTQVYITGGVGQTHLGEAFTFSYDLPNDTIYSETCAAIALIFFAHRMLALEKNGEYADIIERALYNTVLAGMAMDGKHFFYVNPLEVWPEASHRSPVREHVKPQRPSWYPCACCPPNVARLLSSLGKYLYTQQETTVYVNQYLANTAQLTVAGTRVELIQQTDYPWQGAVTLTVNPETAQTFTIAIRLPSWCEKPKVLVNHEAIQGKAELGYLYVTKEWAYGDTINLDFPMLPQFFRANTRVRANSGRVALQRGPLVYCLEQVDNREILSALRVDTAAPVLEKPLTMSFLEGIALVAKGTRETRPGDALYSPVALETVETELEFIPYFMWGNRGEGEMAVWVREK